MNIDLETKKRRMMEDKIKMILDNITDRQTLSVNINKYDPAEIVIVANQFYFVYDKEYSTFEEYIDGL